MNQIKGDKLIIAEDLGDITEEVIQLVEYSGFPGMRVLQFGFLSDSDTPHLPHNYPNNCIAYTGTHDNETMVGWFGSISKEEMQLARDYLCDQHTPKKYLYKSFIAMAMRSVSKYCIIPMQDWLGLDNKSRTNFPSTIGTNWRWRLTGEQLSKELQQEILAVTTRYGR